MHNRLPTIQANPVVVFPLAQKTPPTKQKTITRLKDNSLSMNPTNSTHMIPMDQTPTLLILTKVPFNFLLLFFCIHNLLLFLLVQSLLLIQPNRQIRNYIIRIIQKDFQVVRPFVLHRSILRHLFVFC